MKNHKGYTLVEVLIALALGVIILSAIYSLVNMGQKSTYNIERRVAAHQDARTALEMMSMEIQMASYNPRPDYEGSNFWVSSGNCTASTNQTYKGIQSATDSSITIEMNLDGSASIGDSINEVINYTYDSNNQYISRSTNCTGGDQPFLGDVPGNPRAVRVINTSAVPVFRYFNALGAEIAASSLPAGIPNIARIDITLWVETENADMNTGQRKKAFYSTSIIPRNHVITK
ncbi:MAG: prepilin-type N-terminal cleavage/methylation domain-containing protein [Smithella sp.]|nr:prepilin-type N-terminal cleavage/methylation domain-containing protein [Smithella sp.]